MTGPEEVSHPRMPSDSVQTTLGVGLLLGPGLILFAVHATCGSALLAAAAALSASTTIQLVAERAWPARDLAPHGGRQLAVEAFQGVVYGLVFGVGTIFVVRGG